MVSPMLESTIFRSKGATAQVGAPGAQSRKSDLGGFELRIWSSDKCVVTTNSYNVY